MAPIRSSRDFLTRVGESARKVRRGCIPELFFLYFSLFFQTSFDSLIQLLTRPDTRSRGRKERGLFFKIGKRAARRLTGPPSLPYPRPPLYFFGNQSYVSTGCKHHQGTKRRHASIAASGMNFRCGLTITYIVRWWWRPAQRHSSSERQSNFVRQNRALFFLFFPFPFPFPSRIRCCCCCSFCCSQRHPQGYY